MVVFFKGQFGPVSDRILPNETRFCVHISQKFGLLDLSVFILFDGFISFWLLGPLIAFEQYWKVLLVENTADQSRLHIMVENDILNKLISLLTVVDDLQK